MIRCFVGFHRKQWSFRSVTLILWGKVIEAVFNHRIIEKNIERFRMEETFPFPWSHRGCWLPLVLDFPRVPMKITPPELSLLSCSLVALVPRCFCCKGFSSPWAGFGICPCWSLKSYVFSNAYDWPSAAG